MASTHVYDDELDAIRDRRRLSPITDTELARIAGVSRQSILRYMKPGGDPPYSVVKALAGALGVTVRAEVTAQYEAAHELADAVAAA